MNTASLRQPHRLLPLPLLLLVIALTGCTGDESSADPLPGTIPQTATVTSQDITLQAERALFTGLAVYIELSATTADGTTTGASIAPINATLAGIAATNTTISPNRRPILHFPPAAWPEDATQAELSISALSLLGPDRASPPIAGNWLLPIQLPQGEEAQAARAVEALPPATAHIGGHEVPIETFRMQAATLVRYHLPETVLPVSPPELKAGDDRLQLLAFAPRTSESAPQEVWFEASTASPLTLIFNGLVARDPNSDDWTLEIALGHFDPPSRSEGMQDIPLTWTRGPASTGPEILDITWSRRLEGDGQLSVLIEGLWDSGPAALPVVVGDGAAMSVMSTGGSPAVPGRGDETRINVGLPDEVPPRSLTITFGGESSYLPTLEVPLAP